MNMNRKDKVCRSDELEEASGPGGWFFGGMGGFRARVDTLKVQCTFVDEEGSNVDLKVCDASLHKVVHLYIKSFNGG